MGNLEYFKGSRECSEPISKFRNIYRLNDIIYSANRLQGEKMRSKHYGLKDIWLKSPIPSMGIFIKLWFYQFEHKNKNEILRKI